MRRFNVFIDGSCINNNIREKAIGGWSYIITDNNFNIITEEYGKLREGTQDSVRAELEGLHQALLKMKTFKGNCKFHIYADYEYIVETLNGFSKRTANRDLWNSIEPLCFDDKLAGNFRISHIHSHNKNPKEKEILRELNEKADKLAFAGANCLTKAPVKIAI